MLHFFISPIRNVKFFTDVDQRLQCGRWNPGCSDKLITDMKRNTLKIVVADIAIAPVGKVGGNCTKFGSVVLAAIVFCHRESVDLTFVIGKRILKTIANL